MGDETSLRAGHRFRVGDRVRVVHGSDDWKRGDATIIGRHRLGGHLLRFDEPKVQKLNDVCSGVSWDDHDLGPTPPATAADGLYDTGCALCGAPECIPGVQFSGKVGTLVTKGRENLGYRVCNGCRAPHGHGGGWDWADAEITRRKRLSPPGKAETTAPACAGERDKSTRQEGQAPSPVAPEQTSTTPSTYGIPRDDGKETPGAAEHRRRRVAAEAADIGAGYEHEKGPLVTVEKFGGSGLERMHTPLDSRIYQLLREMDWPVAGYSARRWKGEK